MKKKPSKNTGKAFAVASTMLAALKSYDRYNPELKALELQASRAMKVFNAKDRDEYWRISNRIADMWGELLEENPTTIKEYQIPILVEYLGMLIHPDTYKTFIGIAPYRADNLTDDEEVYKLVSRSVLALGAKLDAFLGTKPYTLVKPKEKKKKEKKPKQKTKKQLAHELEVQKIKESKERKRKALQKMIADAKAKKEKQNENN